MSEKVRMINIVNGEREHHKWHPLLLGNLREIGELTLLDHSEEKTEDQVLDIIREYDIVILSHGHYKLPEKLASNPGKVRYACNLHGTVKRLVDRSIITSKEILVSNWGHAASYNVAEGAMALTLAVLKDIRSRIMEIKNQGWRAPMGLWGGHIKDLDIGIYGAGHIGRRYIEMLKPFEPGAVRVFDPYAPGIPEGCIAVDSLEELFSQSSLIAVHAGLTEETKGSVTAELLAMLPEYGVLINTARGDIVDQDALFRELEKGRLRTGIDVMQDYMPLMEGHPARQYDNLIMTAHNISSGWPGEGKNPVKLSINENICLMNLKRFTAGLPIDEEYVMDEARFDLST